jgi:hypothetical protein
MFFSINRISRAVAFLAVCALVACATAKGADNNFKKEKKAAKEATKESKEARKEAPKAKTLGEAVRVLGDRGFNLAVMHGLEDRAIDEDLAGKLAPEDAAKSLAAEAKCDVQQNAAYAFLYLNKQPYDALTGVTFAKRLDPSYADLKATIALGSKTKLFTALALLGRGLDRTFVVDNNLAETPCGELALTNAPVEAVLEAILKSSRVLGFGVDSTEEFVFISGASTPPPRSALLNAAALDDARRTLLEKRVTVHLPADPKDPKRVGLDVGAETLETAAEGLSRQLGVPVVLDANLKGLPVNPVVMPKIRVGTALDLIVRQWPVRDFGYEVQPDRILIRQRKPSDAS